MSDLVLDIRPTVAQALAAGRPVVALESTLIAQGLPWPINVETARDAERAVRAQGAIPATIAVLAGRPTIGLSNDEITSLAQSSSVRKASARDLAAAVTQQATAATTVSATMRLAHLAGIGVFATGGIGGVHRGDRFDVSADLTELGRTPMLVVCAGAKSILDLPATLEVLETFGVPVVGYRTDDFPAFYLISSGLRVAARADSPVDAARLAQTHWRYGGAGVVLAQPVAANVALEAVSFQQALHTAEQRASVQTITGPALTPFLLARLAEITEGATLRANHALIVANAALAAEVAKALSGD